jgi:17 kDa outer membrane surface antigen
MRTKFGKSFVASGLIAALGVNVMAAGTAYADPGQDRDRSYGRDDSRGRGQDQHRSFRATQPANTAARPDNNKGGDRGSNRGGDHGNDSRRAPQAQPQQNHAPKAQATYRHEPDRAAPSRAPVKIVRKPVTVQRTVVVKQPVVVHEKVVHTQVVHGAPAVQPAHGHPHGYYGPAPTRVIVVPERRRYRNIWVVRDYGHRYYGYGHYHRDDDAYKWLAFTAITVALINNLSEYQQRAYEDAQIRAATAPIGETIQWSQAGAYGTVTATRDGTSSSNRYCREFQKTVTIGGQTEQAYGTACMQPDGAWEVVSDNDG